MYSRWENSPAKRDATASSSQPPRGHESIEIGTPLCRRNQAICPLKNHFRGRFPHAEEAAERLEKMAMQSNLSEKESFNVHVALLKISLASDTFDRAGIERRCEEFLFPSTYGLSAEGSIQLYSILANDPATDHHFKDLFPTLLKACSNLPVKISRQELKSSKSRTDFIFAIMLLRHYEPAYQDALKMVFDVVKAGGMSQDKHETFKEALIQAIHDDNRKPGVPKTVCNDFLSYLSITCLRIRVMQSSLTFG